MTTAYAELIQGSLSVPRGPFICSIVAASIWGAFVETKVPFGLQNSNNDG